MNPIDLIPWALAAAGAVVILGIGVGIAGAAVRSFWRGAGK